MLKNLQQLFDGLAAAENGGRPAGEVDERGMRIDAEVAVNGGQQILRIDLTEGVTVAAQGYIDGTRRIVRNLHFVRVRQTKLHAGKTFG